MPDNIVFELFQESDAQEMADLLNRCRFHSARNKHVTAEDYLFLHRSRGVHFCVVAKKKGKIVGTIGVYPTSDQSVAKKHQAFIGTFLVDMRYRLSYSIILGLYKMLQEELAKTEIKEILTGARPENESAYHLTLKCGFVLLDNETNDFGRIRLHGFTPALSSYVGAGGDEMESNVFFSSLPVVNKKAARKIQGKTRIHENYIECDYLLKGTEVTLLFDLVNLKIDGAAVPKHMKIYPDFKSEGRYVVENSHKKEVVDTTVELKMEGGSGLEDRCFEFTLEPGESKVIECSKEVDVLRFKYGDQWYNLYPNLVMEIPLPKKPIKLRTESLSIALEPSTGFISVMDKDQKLVSFLWPCGTYPYMEGVNDPRMKDLLVEDHEDGLTITEDTNEFQLVRKCLLSEGKMRLITTLTCKTENLKVRPISQIYAIAGVKGYKLKSGEREMTFGPSKIKHQGYEFSDYTYWDTEPERFKDFPVETISLVYPSSTVDVLIDKRSKLIDHAPIFTSTLSFDKNHILKEQVIEELEISYKMEGSNS